MWQKICEKVEDTFKALPEIGIHYNPEYTI